MAEPSLKKRRVGNDSNSRPAENQPPTDSRFSNLRTDARFRLSGKRRPHVKVDKRFSHMLKDEDFTRKAKVDRYGRPLGDDSELKRLKQRYEFEDDVEDVDRRQLLDPIRDGGYSDASSSTESSGETEDSEGELEEEELLLVGQDDVKLGDATSRVAVVNLDWDNIHAVDLMASLSSFVPSNGRLLNVSIYPSQFGKEQMRREETEGPPKELFLSAKDAEQDLDDEHIKEALTKADGGKEVDSTALRRYQFRRLQYFYAILTFSSTEAASAVYEIVDGAEYLSTANFFDLRFVPDETTFDEDEPYDSCEKVPNGYKPTGFVTGALQHSNVKLTWDAEDESRKEAQARAFRGSRKDIDENDLKAYLASDTSDDEDPIISQVPQVDPKASAKEVEKQKLRSLLGLSKQATTKPIKSNTGPVGDMQITFSSGLTDTNDTKKSVFTNDPEILTETTKEKYMRKERERKQRRKEKAQQARLPASSTHNPQPAIQPHEAQDQHSDPDSDLGFDDPFFTPTTDPTATSTSTRPSKSERHAKRTALAAAESLQAAERADLEALMGSDNEAAAGRVRHFDMREIEREEKRARKKNQDKKEKKRRKKGRKEGAEDGAAKAEGGESFQINTQDPRFARVFESHEFAIDPLNPRYRDTGGMRALMEEGRRRRDLGEHGVRQKEGGKQIKAGRDVGGNNDGNGNGNGNRGDEVRRLVDKVKKRSGTGSS